MNPRAVLAIYRHEMNRFFRTVFQSLAAPVITTALYFVVFGSIIGTRMGQIDGVDYGAFITPGLVMLTILTTSVSNASLGFYMPRFTGTVYEVLSAPVSVVEIVAGYVGAAATKSMIIGLVILITAWLFVDYSIAHPLLMLLFLALTAVTFAMVGFALATWADGWERLEVVPMLIITPLTFLGGTFYSIDMLPAPWDAIALFNPAVYLVSGFRWTFNEVSDVNPWISLGATFGFLILCLGAIAWLFRHSPNLRP